MHRHLSPTRKKIKKHQSNENIGKTDLFLKHRNQFQKLKHIFQLEKKFTTLPDANQLAKSQSADHRTFTINKVQAKRHKVFSSALRNKKNSEKNMKSDQNDEEEMSEKKLEELLDSQIKIKKIEHKTKRRDSSLRESRAQICEKITKKNERERTRAWNWPTNKLQSLNGSREKFAKFRGLEQYFKKTHNNKYKQHLSSLKQKAGEKVSKSYTEIMKNQRFETMNGEESLSNLQDLYSISSIMSRPVQLRNKKFFQERKIREKLLNDSYIRKLRSQAEEASISPWPVYERAIISIQKMY